MELIFLIVSLVLATFGGLLLLDFLLWQVQGRVTGATIVGFQEKKSKGAALPVVSFEVEAKGGAGEDEGEKIADVEVKAKALRIDQFLFLLNRPGKDDPTTVIYDKDKPEKARIYGYINVLAGALLFTPLIATMGLKLKNALLLGQVSYILIFSMIIFGGWVFLKLIQRNY